MGKKLTKDQFILQARQVHGWKYDYSKVEYVNSQTKVCIICPEHGEFWQTPNAHMSGQGCPECGGTKKLTTDVFIKRAKEIHGNKYDYSNVKYIDNKTKVCITCPEHGEFWQIPSGHMNNQGCPKCYGNDKHTTQEFIEQARKIHGDKYDYSRVEYRGNKTKVCIMCPIHGEFWQKPNTHLNGSGCRKCSYEMTPRNDRKQREIFIEDAIKVHGKKYDYSKVEYINNKTPVCIICHDKDKYGVEHGEFWQRPDNHLHGQRCPKCANKMSLLEKKICEICHKHNIQYEWQKKFDWLNEQRLDFYLPEYKVAIECQGEQHFKPIDFAGKGKNWAQSQFEKTKIYDRAKKNVCNENGVDIIYYTSKDIKEKYNTDCITDLRQLITILNKKKNG